MYKIIKCSGIILKQQINNFKTLFFRILLTKSTYETTKNIETSNESGLFVAR